jgi:hypothetical protein
MNFPQQAAEYEKFTEEIRLRVVTLECFYWGSSPNFTWIPAQSIGNDGLRTEHAAGNRPAAIATDQ